MTINHKNINWTPSGMLSHFPSGDNVFETSTDILGYFWRPNFGSPITYKMERLSSGTSRVLLSQFPSGDNSKAQKIERALRDCLVFLIFPILLMIAEGGDAVGWVGLSQNPKGVRLYLGTRFSVLDETLLNGWLELSTTKFNQKTPYTDSLCRRGTLFK